MPRKQPQLAKLTRPRLHKAVERSRLFAVLDEAHDHKPAICVVGPPGAGKTTLAASWLDARGIKGIWYQVDPGDADLATFFHYLGEAARPYLRKGQRPLPTLTPEYLQDVGGFGRRFFRELFSRLPEGATLVLDNYQEVDASERFHEIVAQAVNEVPQGACLIAVSRRDPPDAYVRLLTNERVCMVDWDALRLTLEEAHAIGRLREGAGDLDVDRLHAESGGWAAGYTLLLEAARKQEGLPHGAAAGRDALFRYFAALAFAQLPRSTQEILAAIAIFPQVSVSHAIQLTGNVEAQEILEDLYRRHLFTHRRSGDVPVYWFHALFREFLLAEAGRLWPLQKQIDLHHLAAQLLEESGQFEAAIGLLSQIGSWEEAEGSILDHAATLLEQGRGETLRGWIEALPATRIENNAWLRYWLGLSLVPADQTQARTHLELAFEGFRDAGEGLGQMRAASSIIDTYFFEWSHWQPLDRWIDQLEPLMSTCNAYPSRNVEFDIHCSMLIATLYRRPGHHLLTACVERVLSLLESDIDRNRKVAGATLLLTYCYLASRFEFAKRVIGVALPLLETADVAPLNETWWCSRFAAFLNIQGDHEAAMEWAARALRIIDRNGLQGLNGGAVLVEYHLGLAAMALRKWEDARRAIELIVKLARKARPSDVVLEAESKARLAMCRGDFAGALRELPVTLGAANMSGMIYLQVHEMATAAQVCAEAGLYPQTHEHAGMARQLIGNTCLGYWDAEFRIFEAYAEWREGRVDQCRSLLAQGFGLAARMNPHWEHARLSKRVLAAMCAQALEAGTEAAYVRSLIQRFRLPPPEIGTEAWPWAVKILVLGRFELWRDGEQLRFSGKVPKKPLALLKALVAYGGRSVPEERLIDALWPNEEADAAQKSLDITILRLRKLLGGAGTIVVSDGLLGLNAEVTWVDAWAFERRVEGFESGDGAHDESRAAIDLYRGSFLPHDSGEPWSAKMRERLRGKFVHMVEAAALREEASARWERAIALYEKGLEADDLTEAFYQGLMRSHRALGRHAEAMGVFRRMRHLLSVVLGIAPSEASQSLARALQADNPAQFDSR